MTNLDIATNLHILKFLFLEFASEWISSKYKKVLILRKPSRMQMKPIVFTV